MLYMYLPFGLEIQLFLPFLLRSVCTQKSPGEGHEQGGREECIMSPDGRHTWLGALCREMAGRQGEGGVCACICVCVCVCVHVHTGCINILMTELYST